MEDEPKKLSRREKAISDDMGHMAYSIKCQDLARTQRALEKAKELINYAHFQFIPGMPAAIKLATGLEEIEAIERGGG